MDRESLNQQLELFIKKVHKQYPIDFAYLFGSFVTDRYNGQSDIDLAFKLKEKYNDDEEVFIKGNIIDLGIKYFDRRVDVVLLHTAPPQLKYEVIKSGLVLKDSPNRASFESLTFREYFDFRYYSDIYNKALIKRIQG
ncbi:nucleotidyltransferase domain-containing protein [Proteinivorax tanatarense]|uniref:Nucleotidyltransferase domain-containing protein n=1 Tax=Proteinivorax tanatarense TaxID=1260629 RepID=A0AAU7VQ77_9FIRM